MDYALLGVVGIIIVVTVAAFATRLGVAAPLVLVVVGIVVSFLPGVPDFDFPPEIILAVVLPPILYSAAVNVPIVDFRRNLKAITGLSVLLVIVSAVISGLVLHLLLPDLSIAAAIALGAVISPPDAVAATAIGKRLGLPPRLVTVLEGEGLVNDASALVLLRSAVAATAGAVTFAEIAGDFVYAVVAAILVGFVVGHVTVRARSRLDDPVLNTAISFAIPFLAYFPAEQIEASGVLAVVVAGLVTGHRSASHFSAQDRLTERINWRTVQFILENGVFLLMGIELKALVDQVHDDDLGAGRAVLLGLIVTGVLVLVRVAFVIPLVAVLRRDQRRAVRRGVRLDGALDKLDRLDGAADEPESDKQEDQAARRRRARRFLTRRRADAEFLTSEGLGWRGGAVLAWSGMRGVVTLAAAQSLPSDIPYRPQLVLVAFTVAIVTLLAQGGTLPLLIRALKITGSDAAADRAELADLYETIASTGLAVLDNPMLEHSDGVPFAPGVIDRVRADSLMLNDAIAEHEADETRPYAQQRDLRLIVLQAERAALLDARASREYSSRVLERAQHMLDLEESRLTQLRDGSA